MRARQKQLHCTLLPTERFKGLARVGHLTSPIAVQQHMRAHLIKVYCLEPFDQVTCAHPHVDFDIYIDDVQMSASGSPDNIASDIVAAACDTLGHPSAPLSAAVVGSPSQDHLVAPQPHIFLKQ